MKKRASVEHKLVFTMELEDGIVVVVPDEARWICKCPRGIWYWNAKKPIKMTAEKTGGTDICWTPQKVPFQTKNKHGHTRVVMGTIPDGDEWQKTATEIIKSELIPVRIPI